MASASRIIGISGGFIILLISTLGVLIDGLITWLVLGEGLAVLPFLVAWVGVLASIVAIIGAKSATTNPKVGAIMMLASVIPGALALNPPVCFGGLLLIIASVLAFLTYRRQQSQPELAP